MTPDAIGMLASELIAAYANGEMLPSPPSSRYPDLDLPTAYAVEAEVVRRRRAAGHVTVGRKVGFANKAMWRILKLDTLVWASMYDDTVHDADTSGQASLSLAHRVAPRIEPEVVCKLKRSIEPAEYGDPSAVLDAVEWIALGFEINDCVFPEWKFQPADFVAAFGFHTALVVGPHRVIRPDDIAALVEQLPRFGLKLFKNRALIEEGSGKNSLRSPALCVGELARVIANQPGAKRLAAGELISTGTLTTPQPIAAGDTWHVEVEGIDLAPLTVTFTD